MCVWVMGETGAGAAGVLMDFFFVFIGKSVYGVDDPYLFFLEA